MSNTTAAHVAEILEIPLMRVIADLELERGTNDSLWKAIAKKVAIVAGAAVCAHLAQRIGADSQQLVEASALFVSALPVPVYYVNYGPFIGAAAIALSIGLALALAVGQSRRPFCKLSDRALTA